MYTKYILAGKKRAREPAGIVGWQTMLYVLEHLSILVARCRSADEMKQAKKKDLTRI